MPRPLFSIVITNYNKSDYIVASVESALKQTIADDRFEVVVVDDCSTDDSFYKLSCYANAIKKVQNERNCGAMVSVLNGVKASAGEYIVTLDGDDLLAPNLLEMLANSKTLSPRRMIRGKISSSNNPALAIKNIDHVSVAYKLSPAWKLTLQPKTGGSSLVFPRKILLDLTEHFPQICVQDHIIPELMSLHLEDYIQLNVLTHFACTAEDIEHLSDNTTQLHHDRLLCGLAVLRHATVSRLPNVLLARLSKRVFGRCMRYMFRYRLWRLLRNMHSSLFPSSHSALEWLGSSIAKEMRLKFPSIRYYGDETSMSQSNAAA